MNGVRRFLGGGGGSSSSNNSSPATPEAQLPTAPLVISGKPNWPPSASSPTSSSSPVASPTAASNTNTPPLAFRKPKRSPDLNGNGNGGGTRTSLPQSPGAGPSSPRVLPSRVSQLSRKSTGAGAEWKRSSQMLNVRDDLLMSLLASEAIVDSRDYDILSSEEVEELKQVRLRLHV